MPASWSWKWFAFYDSYPFFIIINLIVPIIAFSALLFVRRFKFSFKNDLYFIIFLLVIGLFAQSGLNGPTGFIYNWLFYYFPPIRSFTTTHLFYSPLIYLGYSILLGVSSYYIVRIITKGCDKKKIRHSRKSVAEFLTVFLIVILILTPSYPVIDGSAVVKGSPSSEVQIPPYVTNVSDYLNAQGGEFNVLTLPLFQSVSQENYPNGGYFGTNPLHFLVNDPIISETAGLSPIQTSELSIINNAIYYGNTITLLNFLISMNIKYVVVMGDYNSSLSGILEPFSMTRTLGLLNSSSGIIPIRSINFYPYFIYRVYPSHNLVYASVSEHYDSNASLYGSNLINSSVSYSSSNYSSDYTYYKFNYTTPSLLIDYNYTRNITPNSYIMTINHLHINSNQYNYLIFNYSTNDNNITIEINRYTNESMILQQIKTSNGFEAPLPSGVMIRNITFFWFPLDSANSDYNIYITSIIPKLVDYYPYPVLIEQHLITNLTFTDANISPNQNISEVSILNTDYRNPTSIELEVGVSGPTNFTLVLSTNYDSNWIINNQNGVKSHHIVVNGYMNAWILTFTKPGNYVISISYKEQILTYDLQLVSLLSTIVISAFFLIYFYSKGVKKRILNRG